jgi:hypothetical protein
MHRVLAVFMGIAAFLAVTLYWLWQLAAGHPAVELWVVGLRATVAMVVTFLLGLWMGRLGASLVAEACNEARARRRDRERAREAARAAESAGGVAEGTGTGGEA